ncbi:acyl-CoA synthetase FdrA [Alkaliphilus serpentinus]|uniref:Acyl-CoA synthetase FdrA n=1 Tax=Alkaliphilus serpentinus TaxID=1482731 RepID=A0A833HQQ5_9FIRM|nr:acyl-CoA synthetase FdrA [Alkaliphilus serpentinus]KAB3532091.1 acyl-CoA synthetase FdrA [Alkaliphilus serpentinus]
MNKSVRIQKNKYYDSVTLMLVSKELKKLDGVNEVLVGMATDLNKELVGNLGLSNNEIEELNANDFFITVEWEREENLEELLLKVEELLNKKDEASDDYSPATLSSALKYMDDANLVIISVPGKYAYQEAKKALNKNLHVMLFSDNVKVEEEKELKEIARDKGLLMMGPDCGTAIINQVPLAFGNVVNKGHIGIVAASGTGAQEVSVIIDKLGGGISQAIGTGGRDLSKEIGGIMMLQGIKALTEDEETKVLLLVSKPPSPEIAEKVLQAAKDGGKPFVVSFIGGSPEVVEKYGGVYGASLEDAAIKAVELTGLKAKSMDSNMNLEELLKDQLKLLKPEQKYLRGLYTGGTLCDEAMKLLSKDIGGIYSNIPLKPQLKLENLNISKEHTCIDLGDDDFTVGRPHPMIDPSTRQERLLKEAEDPEVAVFLMDFVLGYGSNPDPAGEMVPFIKRSKEVMMEKGVEALYIASVCGTEKDPQNLREQEAKLKEAGVIILPSNAKAVAFSAEILKYQAKR